MSRDRRLGAEKLALLGGLIWCALLLQLAEVLGVGEPAPGSA
ncbi:MAG: hypothetical protein ACRDTT_23855 [Pseudonocardiaceae bacterium]